MESVCEYPDVDGFQIIAIKSQLDLQEFHINIKNESDFEKWKHGFCELTSSTFNIMRTTRDTQKAVFLQRLKCQHGVQERKEYQTHKKSYTG